MAIILKKSESIHNIKDAITKSMDQHRGRPKNIFHSQPKIPKQYNYIKMILNRLKG
jgi:hypothetical protein